MNVTCLIVRAGSGIHPSTVAQHQHLSRTDAHALAKAKLNPQTFTAIDLTNKANITKQGTHAIPQVFGIGKEDGDTGNGLDYVHTDRKDELNNEFKQQQATTQNWAMIKEAL
jgi:hypothetical protein